MKDIKDDKVEFLRVTHWKGRKIVNQIAGDSSIRGMLRAAAIDIDFYYEPENKPFDRIECHFQFMGEWHRVWEIRID